MHDCKPIHSTLKDDTFDAKTLLSDLINMYPTFTGSARSKRQVNLSGRTNNPFAAYGSSNPSTTTQTSHNAIAHAQQERILREHERRRPPAAAKIQRTWRGHRSRRETRRQWRQEWDTLEAHEMLLSDKPMYPSLNECLKRLRLLAQFVSSRSESDAKRICHFSRRYLASSHDARDVSTEAWVYPSLRLARSMIQILRAPDLGKYSPQDIRDLCLLLARLTSLTASYLASHSHEYYEAVNNASGGLQDEACLQELVVVLLHRAQSNLEAAYEGFAWVYLAQARLAGFSNGPNKLSHDVQYQTLATALVNILSVMSNQQLLQKNVDDGLLWLLSYFIFFHRHSGVEAPANHLPDAQYIKVVSRLITALAEDIGERIDSFDLRALSANVTVNGGTQAPSIRKLPDFIRSQILSLVDQENVSGLLTKLETDTPLSSGTDKSPSEASALASYVLTLLRVFPRRRSDIHMWLYRGSVVCRSDSQRKLPATKYLYQAVQTTSLFNTIKQDPKQAIRFLSPDKEGSTSKRENFSELDAHDQQWRIVLLFLELYSFILQVMDDEEFRSGKARPDSVSSWTKQSALPLADVESLSIFLKNLAFALYWYPSQIAGEQEQKKILGLAAYFGRGESHVDQEEDMLTKSGGHEVARVSGMTIESLKGLVVGVLRMIYQRE